ncbi:Ribulose-1,5-bisphosphate carboxylase small subunit, N-terminal [Cynara cardunculus var. scolymus]|uniref:Ribulose bisphosphate carboxylase small subunit, chloroplastic n=1 Tax=Cynara cardunculus var. scolymus TaxID=59895 RepID=A0A103Y1B7_CYNCS|nr:Ribulose-1,5-bisphosphate carboxylase small subunit, N-terminal [Cynara cardunculus var. scolymus]
MASISASSATVATPGQLTLVAPFTGLKSNAAFPLTKKSNNDLSSLPSNGGRVHCMKVWPPLGLKKYETLSYLPPLPESSLAKEIDYLLRNKSPGYYDGRYWTMWKLPMFGCTDSAQVLKELNECKKEYPNAFIRIIGFDNVRQVQCISFIAHKPKGTMFIEIEGFVVSFI